MLTLGGSRYCSGSRKAQQRRSMHQEVHIHAKLQGKKQCWKGVLLESPIIALDRGSQVMSGTSSKQRQGIS